MAWSAVSTTDFLTCDANFEFLVESGQAKIITLNPRETAQLVFNVDAAGVTDDLEIEILQGHRISNGSGLDGATSTSDVELNTSVDSFTTDDDMNGLYIIMTSGGEAGEGRLIVDSVAADDGVNLSHALSGTPSATETYALYRFSPFRFTMDPQTTVDSDNQNNAGITVHGANGEYVAVVARSTGATDAHRVRMSYQLDGVSA
jgi:hypothetical protein